MNEHIEFKMSKCELFKNMTKIRCLQILVVLSLSFFIYTLFAYLVPYMGDDIIFAWEWQYNNGTLAPSWQGYLHNTEYLRHTDNGRFFNSIFPLMVICFPKWVNAVIIGLFAAIMFGTMAKLSQIYKTKQSVLYLALLWLYIIVFMPWSFTMNFCNALNSIGMGCLYLLFILILSYVQKKQCNIIVLVGFCVVSLFIGAAHESYSVAVGTGMLTYALIHRFRIPKNMWMVGISFAIGSLWCLSAHGIWVRLDYEVDKTVASFFSNKRTLLALTPWMIILIMLSYILLNETKRKQLIDFIEKDMVVVITFIAGIVGLIIAIFTGIHNPRALWLSLLFISIPLWRIFAYMNFDFKRVNLITGVLIVGIIAFYSNVLHWQYFHYKQNNRIISLLKNSETGTIYFDYDISCPKTTLLHPLNTVWWDFLHYIALNKFALNGKIFAVVPTELKSIKRGDMSLLPGNAHLSTYKNCIVSNDIEMEVEGWNGINNKATVKNIVLNYELENGTVLKNIPTLMMRFISPDGEKLIYYQPLHLKVQGPYLKIDYAL